MIRTRSGPIVLSLLLATVAFAQTPTMDELLDRINRLEEKDRRQQQRILELEARVSDQGGVPTSELETLISTLSQETAAATVSTPKSNWLKVGGQLVIRGEHRTVKDYGGDVDEGTDFVIQRTRLHFDFDVVENVRVFVQFQDSRKWGDEGNPAFDLESVDLHQGYVDFQNVFGHDWTFRVGRQKLKYGDQRLISPLEWHPVSRSWDGVRTWFKGESFQLDAFITTIVENTPPPGFHTDDDEIFAGLYVALEPFEDHELDVYVLYRSFADGAFTSETGGMGDLEDASIGVRFKGSTSGFDYSAEGVYQFGDRGGDDVEAYAWALVAGYTFDCAWSPRVSLEWDFASGDDDPTDGDFETFDPLYPFGHYFQGSMDIFAWRNGHDFALRVSARPTEDMWVEVAAHLFVLDSDKDAWYNAAGMPIRRVTAGGVDNTVGVELDIHVKYNLNEATLLWFGYSHFFAGDYVEDTGDHPDQDWFFFQIQVTF